jgi:hypothetical protein
MNTEERMPSYSTVERSGRSPATAKEIRKRTSGQGPAAVRATAKMSDKLRIVRRLPYPPEEVWSALINNCELGKHCAMLRFTLIGEHLTDTARITVYESRRVLQCSWDDSSLRWELDGRDGATSVTFTHTWKSSCALRRASEHLYALAAILVNIPGPVENDGAGEPERLDYRGIDG